MAPRPERSRHDPELGLRIELAMLRAGITQAALARKVGVTPGAVGHWLKGRPPTPDRIKIIARALDVKSVQLMGENPTEGDKALQKVILKTLVGASPETRDALIEILAQSDNPEELLACLRGSPPAADPNAK